MKFKFLKSALIGFALIFMNTSYAGLIEADYANLGDNLAVYDTETSLTWLDLSQTQGMSYEFALQSHQGWRHATNLEVEQLFSTALDEQSYTSGKSHNYSGTIGYDQAMAFARLFSPTLLGSTIHYYFGLYEDGTNILRMAGIENHPILNRVYVYGEDWPVTYGSYYNHGTAIFGSYLVKEENMDVPEPSTLAIFALGMIGLASLRFKKE